MRKKADLKRLVDTDLQTSLIWKRPQVFLICFFTHVFTKRCKETDTFVITLHREINLHK